jgi:hypothetical protein
MTGTRSIHKRQHFSALLAGALALWGLAALPVLADSGAAVWVPFAPATGQTGGPAGRPVVLVPYEQSLQLGERPSPQAWVPDYLPSGWRADVLPTPPDAAERLRNLPSHDSIGLVGYGLSAGAWDAPPAPVLSPARPLADVLRDAGWHRDTAARLRAQDSTGMVD